VSQQKDLLHFERKNLNALQPDQQQGIQVHMVPHTSIENMVVMGEQNMPTSNQSTKPQNNACAASSRVSKSGSLVAHNSMINVQAPIKQKERDVSETSLSSFKQDNSFSSRQMEATTPTR
jgi:hypothetical protein